MLKIIEDKLTGNIEEDIQRLMLMYIYSKDRDADKDFVEEIYIVLKNNIDKLLNKVLSEEIKYINYYEDKLEISANLAELILNYEIKQTSFPTYNTKVSLNQSIEICTNFLENVYPEYAYRFQNLLSSFLLDKNKKDKEKQIIFKKGVESFMYNGQAYINYNESIEDIYNLVHEVTHLLSCQNIIEGKEYILRSISQVLSETPTITMEFLLSDYLKDKYPKEEVDNFINLRLINIQNNCQRLLLENEIYKLYLKNNNYISYDLIVEYFANQPKDSLLYKLFGNIDFLNDNFKLLILNSDHLRYFKLPAYIIGALEASYLYKEICENPQSKEKLITLIHVLGNNDLSLDKDVNTLAKIGFPLITSVRKKDYEILKESFEYILNKFVYHHQKENKSNN